MVVIEIRFLMGRYHASPWDAEANEGKVEWPPSPWRIARALISTFFERHPDQDRATVETLVGKLAASVPSYYLPPAVHTHTRHYMPRTDADKTRKTFDAFLRFPPGDDNALVVQWDDVKLTGPERELLEVLLRDMGYFGRAESLAQGRVLPESPRPLNCFLDVTDSGAGEVSEVLALESLSEFDTVIQAQAQSLQRRWLAVEREKAQNKGKDLPEKLTKSQQKKLDGLIPGSAFDALCVTTEDLQKAGFSRPLGTRWLRYRRDEVRETPRLRMVQSTGRATFAVFKISRDLLPSASELIRYTDRLHKSLVKRTSGAELAGVHDDGTPRTGHGHAHVLIEPNSHGRIEQFVIWAPDGFAIDEADELERLNLWGRGDFLPLLLTSVGDIDSFSSDRLKALGKSPTWRSVTPFVATRHPKCSRGGEPKLDLTYQLEFDGVRRSLQKGSPEHDLVRLLIGRGLPRPLRISTVHGVNFGAVQKPWRSFETKRPNDGKGRRGPSAPTGFEIEFAEPVSGPIVAGYGAHFGLGMFEPV